MLLYFSFAHFDLLQLVEGILEWPAVDIQVSDDFWAEISLFLCYYWLVYSLYLCTSSLIISFVEGSQ